MNGSCSASDVLRWHAVAAGVLVAVAAVAAVLVDPVWWNAAGLLVVSGSAAGVASKAVSR